MRFGIGRVLVCALPAALSFACAVGPDYRQPAPLDGGALPEAFGDASVGDAGAWKIAAPAADIPRGDWWEMFGDAELSRLEALAADHNQQIAAAAANFAEARAAVAVAQSAFFPQITGSPSATRQSTSANASPTSAGAGRNITFSQFVVTADASWEVDLWGRIRRGIEGAGARFTASADDLQSARLAVQAEVATDYFTLRALDEQFSLLERTAADYGRALELTQNRHNGGVATELDVAQAETQLDTAKAEIPAVDLQRAQTRHALAVLCGQPATTFALGPETPAVANPPAIPVSVPSEWLEHRPDIASVERRMAAANADVGVATAAFYPRLLLNGSGGLESISAGTLFNWPSRVWAVGPTLQLPIFTGGANRAQLASARAAYEDAVSTYRQTVLTAFQDVEDQLAAHVLLANQLDEERAALAAARRALEISNNRYKAGVEQYLDVITAQTAVLTAEQNVARLSGLKLAASAALIKAMGGGWAT